MEENNLLKQLMEEASKRKTQPTADEFLLSKEQIMAFRKKLGEILKNNQKKTEE